MYTQTGPQETAAALQLTRSLTNDSFEICCLSVVVRRVGTAEREVLKIYSLVHYQCANKLK